MLLTRIIQDNKFDRLSVRLYRNGVGVIYCAKVIYPESDERHELTQYERTKKRQFIINRTKLQSACIAAWCAKQSKTMLFLTFTFPGEEPDEKTASKIWNRMLNALRNTYDVKNYVWVKEKGGKRGRIHYHILIDRNRIGIKNLQRTWEFCNIRFRPHVDIVTHNSVRLGKRPIVSDIRSVKTYLSKYMAKNDNQTDEFFESRAWGCSRTYRLYREVDIETCFKMVAIGGRNVDRVFFDCVEGVTITHFDDFFVIFRVKNYIDASGDT